MAMLNNQMVYIVIYPCGNGSYHLSDRLIYGDLGDGLLLF